MKKHLIEFVALVIVGLFCGAWGYNLGIKSVMGCETDMECEALTGQPIDMGSTDQYPTDRN